MSEKVELVIEVNKLNETDLYEEKISLGLNQEEMKAAFIEQVKGVPDEREKEIPDSVIELYNKLTQVEKSDDAVPKKPEEKKPAPVKKEALAAKKEEPKKTAPAAKKAVAPEKVKESKSKPKETTKPKNEKETKEVKKIDRKREEPKKTAPAAKKEEPKKAAPKAATKATAPAAKKATDKPKKDVERSVFGSKKGTAAFELDKLLLKGGKTIEQLVEAVGGTRSHVVNHIQNRKSKGAEVENKDGKYYMTEGK